MSSTTFTTNVLIGDRSAQGNVATPTKIGGVPVAAALEVQSTSGGLLLPRMTGNQIDAEIASGSKFAVGTILWNTDYNALATFDVNGLVLPPPQYLRKLLSQADVIAMYEDPVEIIPAPFFTDALIIIDSITIINNFSVVAFNAGGPVRIQYGNTINHGGGFTAVAGDDVSQFLPQDIITSLVSTSYTASSGKNGVNILIPIGDSKNVGIYISNFAGAFGAGDANSSVSIHVSYRALAYI